MPDSSRILLFSFLERIWGVIIFFWPGRPKTWAEYNIWNGNVQAVFAMNTIKIIVNC